MPIAAVAAALALFVFVFIERSHLHFSNVDEYTYAAQTRAYGHGLTQGVAGLVDAVRGYASYAPLVPVMALPIAAVSESPHSLILVQLLFLALLAVSCWSILRTVDYANHTAVAVACAITSLPPVLKYAGLYHFAVASTACAALTAAGYLSSERFTRRVPSAVTGIGFGLLAISRTIAIVYVAALAAAIVIDLALAKRLRRDQLVNAGVGALIALVLAGPWWALNGRSAINYLAGLGYDPSWGFAPEVSAVERVRLRTSVTAYQTGSVLAAVTALLAAITLVRVRGTARLRPVGFLCAVSVIGLATLCTSSTGGSGFALPLVVLMACGVAAGARSLSRITQTGIAVATAALGALSFVLAPGLIEPRQIGGDNLWSDPVIVRREIEHALGCDCRLPNLDALNRDIYRVVGGASMLVIREDSLVNFNSLQHWARMNEQETILDSPPYGAELPDRAELASAEFVLGGRSPASYHRRMDSRQLPFVLRAAGFRPLLVRQLSPRNELVLWARADL